MSRVYEHVGNDSVRQIFPKPQGGGLITGKAAEKILGNAHYFCRAVYKRKKGTSWRCVSKKDGAVKGAFALDGHKTLKAFKDLAQSCENFARRIRLTIICNPAVV